MFIFFVLMLLLAAMTDHNNEVITNEKIVNSELATSKQLTNEVISDNVLKN